VDGTPYQYVPASAVVPFEIVDASCLDASCLDTSCLDASSLDMAARLRSAASRPFNLAEGPLLRCTLFRLSANVHVLLLCLHHAVIDGHSVGPLLGELALTYNAAVRDEAAALPDLPLQYGDFAVWQRRRPPAAANDTVEYWRSRLAQLPHFSVAPVGSGGVVGVAAPAAPVGTLDAGIDSDLARAVDELAARTGTTPMVVLLAAWACVLHRVSPADAVTVLAPVANRPQAQLEAMVGFFVNTVVLTVDVSDNPSIEDFLGRVHDACAGAYAHQDLPFDLLVEELRPLRRIAQTPFSDVIFSYLDGGVEDVSLVGLQVEHVRLEPRHAKCELVFEVQRGPSGYGLHVEYRADVFDIERPTLLLRGFTSVLAELVGGDLARPLGAVAAAVAVAAFPSPAGGPAAAAALAGGAERPDPTPLVSLFAALLGIPRQRIGPDDDFFGLGGNSLLAMRLVARIRAGLAPDLPARVVFEHPTIAGLSRWIADQRAAVAAPDPHDDLRRLQRPASWSSGGGPAQVWTTEVSSAQRRLWFLEQLEPTAAAYHVPVVLRVGGALDLDALRGALADLVARHEILRAWFVAVDGQPVQHVAASGDIPIRTHDRSAAGVDSDDRDGVLGSALGSALRELVDQEVHRPFDLSQPPLVRVLVVREHTDAHLIVLTMHHIVADGWSASLFVRDVAAFYTARTIAAPSHRRELPKLPELPELSVQYPDVAAWQAQRLTDGRLDTALAYWARVLAGAPAVLDLPTDRPRAAVPGHRGREVRFMLDDQVTAQVRRAAGASGATPFMVLLAAMGVALGRHASVDDVVIGTPVANRARVELEDLIGFFVNTVPLRVDLSGDPTVEQLLARVRQVCVGAYEHQDLPFERLVEAVGAPRDAGRNPLFQVMLALQDDLAPVVTLPGLAVDLVDYDAGTSKFDLTIVVEDRGTTMTGVARYNNELFDHSTMERLVDHLLRALEGIVADGSIRVSELDVLSDQDRQRQLHDYNAAAADYSTDLPLHALVQAQAMRTPDAVALAGCLSCSQAPCTAEPAVVTYAQLVARAGAISTELMRQGARRGDVVAILLDRSADLVVAELATLRAGAAFLPLDPTHPPARNAAIVADAGCRLVLTCAQYLDLTPPVATVLVDQPGAGDGSDAPGPAPGISGDDAAYVIYTSGSTGAPKGVVVPHRGIVNNLLWMQQDWPLSTQDRLLFKTVHTFDVAVKEVFWPLLSGGRVVIAHPGTHRDATEICAQIVQHSATVVHLVPSMLDVVLQVARERDTPLSSLRIVMSGAEALAPATHDALLAAVPALLLHMYGPTETAIAVTGWPCRNALGEATLPLGRAMPNTQLYVLDDRLRLCPEGALGELYVGGMAVGRGYLGQPGATAQAFVPDPFSPSPGARFYRTGDVVRYRSDGLLEFHGRRDGQVKIRGLRIELGEVSNVLARHPAVRQCAVGVWPRGKSTVDDRPTALVAYVVAEGDTNPGELRAYLRERLPGYLVPGHIELLPALPTGATGKVDHDQLPPPGRSSPAVGDGQATTGPTQLRLVQIWCDLLETSVVGAGTDFFDLGGHSLLATRLVTRIRAEFGVDVPLRVFFAEPTIDALATLIDGGARTPVARIPVLDRSAFATPFDD
jgi:amino acid adenylation domain-containing protein